jgi:outer membrane protein insertion porin family/translocation and assembly module TamA
VALIFALVPSSASFAKGGGAPIQGEVVKSIAFEGNAGFLGGVSDSTLRAAMEQSQSPGTWWIRPAERAVVLDRNTLNRDAWRLETWYANHGYFDVRVRGWDVVTIREGDPAKNRPKVVKIVGHVAEKGVSTIRKIKWEGMDDLGKVFVSVLSRKAALQTGEVFAIEAVKETEGQALNQLHEMSFGFATVRTEVDSYPEEGTVDVRVIAETGPACRFGPITVTGKYDIPEEFVREEVTIKEGKAFRASKLAETQRRLFALGVFSVVNVVPDLSSQDEGIIPVRLELSESKYRQLRAGGGVQLESGKQDVHGVVEYQHVNVFNRLWNLTTGLRPGYAWIATFDDLTDEKTEVQKSPTGTADIELTIPHFPVRNWTLSAKTDAEYGLENGYEFFSPSVGPDIAWQVNPKLGLRLGYNLKFFKYFDLSADDQLGQNRFGLNFTNPYVLSALSQEVIWNTRDNALFPTNGEYIVTSLKEAGGPIGGGFNYLEMRSDIRIFRRIRKLLFFRPNITIGARLGGGAMLPYESSQGQAEVPFAERFLLGGGNDVRGWARAHLGPYLCDAEAYSGGMDLNDPKQAAMCAGMLGRSQETTAIQPVGGTSYLHGTFEIRKYTVDGYGIAVFNDWGMVWNSIEEIDPLQLVPSAGVGFRYKSPIGAIRLDGAYRFNTEPMFEKEPSLQVHFGLSEAF